MKVSTLVLFVFATFFITFIFQICSVSDKEWIHKNNSDVITGEVKPVEETKNCLVNQGWLYPNQKVFTYLLKFSKDGTFNFSTLICGGMRAWGRWMIESLGKVKITYTCTTKDALPDDLI